MASNHTTTNSHNTRDTRKIWDISPPVDEHAAVFPGDTAYSQRLHFSLAPDCPVNVHSITLSPHTGAHADAPMHYANGGQSSGELDLVPYLGPCRVIHCLDAGPLVMPEHIAHALDDLPARVLLRTAHSAHRKPILGIFYGPGAANTGATSYKKHSKPAAIDWH